MGAPNHAQSLVREKKIIRWLNAIQHDAQIIFLVGDIFDFWYEYKSVVPKGYVRLLGKLAELTDNGIEIRVFTGNHDMWMFGYFEEELNIKVARKPESLLLNETKIHIGHGDGLGPGDYTYKLLKRVFENKINRFLFSRIHPNFAIGLAKTWSSRSRAAEIKKEEAFFGEKEWLIQYCKQIQLKNSHHYYIFGHRHYPIQYALENNAEYINLGEWMNYYTYAVFDGTKIVLKTFENE